MTLLDMAALSNGILYHPVNLRRILHKLLIPWRFVKIGIILFSFQIYFSLAKTGTQSQACFCALYRGSFM